MHIAPVNIYQLIKARTNLAQFAVVRFRGLTILISDSVFYPWKLMVILMRALIMRRVGETRG